MSELSAERWKRLKADLIHDVEKVVKLKRTASESGNYDTAEHADTECRALRSVIDIMADMERECEPKFDGIPHQRCWDLLRQMRGRLIDEKLISAREYVWLVSEAPGVSGRNSPAPRRLESYDELKERLDQTDTITEQRDAAISVLEQIRDACVHVCNEFDLNTLRGGCVHCTHSFVAHVAKLLTTDFLTKQETA